MQNHHPPRSAQLRAVIVEFLNKRLTDKLEAIKGDGPEDQQRREHWRAKFEQAVWLGDAAKRVGQIQLVTHVLKATHPDPKISEATNLYVPPGQLSKTNLFGSHVLDEHFAPDVTGNAAALDVYGFLTEPYQTGTLLELMRAGDSDMLSALSDDQETAQKWMTAFASIDVPRCPKPTSHTLAKQLYWPVADDLHDDASYHLLAPLYASSLAHRLYQTLQDDRFSDEAKTAREARKAHLPSERPVRDYPNLAVQQLGGTKPQNISQLNSERRGQNSLLASLPPQWQSVDLKPLLGTESMFTRYKFRPAVKENLGALLAFLKTDPTRNVATRDRRAGYVDNLIDDFLQFTAEVRTLVPGWTCDSACRLPDSHARWLDPEGAAQADAELERTTPTDTHERISEAFANWLNAQLRDPLPMGDPEFDAWCKAMEEHILAEEREGLHDH